MTVLNCFVNGAYCLDNLCWIDPASARVPLDKVSKYLSCHNERQQKYAVFISYVHLKSPLRKGGGISPYIVVVKPGR